MSHSKQKVAEMKASSVFDWIRCAESWLHSKQGPEALRCLIEAEKLADDTQLWRICSDFWIERFNNNAEASRCLQEAEKLAAEAEDFLYLAHGWLNLGKKEDGKRCLLLYESNPGVDVRFLTWAADIWSASLQERESAIRCLHRAEGLSQHPAEWGWCAESWHRLGDKKKELLCIERKAEAAKRMFGP